MAAVNIKEIKSKYQKVLEKLSSSKLVLNKKDLLALSRTKKHLETIIEKYKAFIETGKAIIENMSMIEKDKDPDLSVLAKEEIEELQEKEKALERELKDLIKQDETESKQGAEIKSIIMEIRAGAGGEEASLFAQKLFRMYEKYADSQAWKRTILESHKSELQGYKEIIFELKGKDVFSKMKQEAGVHRVQRIPDTEKRGRIHTSTVSVAVLAQPEELKIKIKPSDLKIETYGSSGPGGQYVNKRETAVRVIHIPTGTVATCQVERSQEQNKQQALFILKARIFQKQKKEMEQKLGGERRSQIGQAQRSEKVRTYNFPQDRITDHRIKKSWHNVEEIMDGKMGKIVKAFQKLNK